MANSVQASQAVNAAAAQVVASDPDLARSLRRLAREVIEYQRYVMRFGSPSEKLSLVKSMLPQMLNAMNKVEGEEADKERREAYERIMASLRGDATVAG